MLNASDIKNARDFLGESQMAFGKRFAVDQSTVHRWETYGPPRRGLARKALEVLINELAAKDVPKNLTWAAAK